MRICPPHLPPRSVPHLQEELLQQPGLLRHRPLNLRVVLVLDQGDRRLDVLPDLRGRVEEVDDVVESLVLQQEHVLPQRLAQRKEAALGVVPGVDANLPLVRLERLDDAADTELVVALGAVESADDQVNYAEVVDGLAGVSDLLLLLLHEPHQLLCLLVRRRHDVGHAEVRQDDGGDAKKVVVLLTDDRLVVADALLELLLHEEDVRDVQLPGVVLAAELRGLPEDLLDHEVVLHVPVDLGLPHEHGDVLGEGGLELVEVPPDRPLVALLARVLQVLRAAAESLNVLGGELVEASVRLLGGGLGQDEPVEELVVLRVHALVGEVRVLREDVRRQVVVAVLAVEQEEVHKRLRRGRVLAEEEVQLPEALRGLLVHLHERLVVQRHGIQLRLVPGRHVVEGVARRVQALHLVLDGGLQVEGLHEGGLAQDARVPHAAGLQATALVQRADAELRVVAHAALDDLGDVL
mmetsp:Transcript_49220/g.145302  ORF Transcript_49220/g.145302 Transcript_49220/m.145302 type:complete len:465 (+) Transcript_49220:106-1500(+)